MYAFIDRLVAARLVDTVIVGQRPMSRLEVGRIIGEARRRAEAGSWLGVQAAVYGSAFPEQASRAVVSLLEGDVTAMHSPPRGIETDANGAIDVAVNPLVGDQLGRPIADGLTISRRVSIAGNVTSWLAVGAAERQTRVDPRGDPAKTRSRFEEAYARALWKNVAITLGRGPLFLGQGERTGLILSMNARPVDQVRIESDHPFVLPSLLRLAGPTRGTIALGDLGPRQFFPHTRLLAYKVSSRPHPRFEIGTGFSEQVGGDGSPPGTFLQKAGDAFPLLDAFLLHRNFKFSNKFVLVDLRYSLPAVRGAQFYAEGAFDDFDLRRPSSTFTEDAAYIWGLSASCFTECGPVRAALEYHVTGLRFYTHGDFHNGYTLERNIIGDPLGPRGRGLLGAIQVDATSISTGLELAYEDRNGNKYGSVSTTPDDSDFRFVILEHHPAERRWRSMVNLSLGSVTDRLRYSFAAGAERVENFAHAADVWRTNWLTRVGVEYRPTGFH